jgi:hypothetical protein
LSATYAATLVTGKVYSLRWAAPGADAAFAELPVARDVEGTLVFRVPYVPRAKAAVTR